jgi:hypothetical protein
VIIRPSTQHDDVDTSVEVASGPTPVSDHPVPSEVQRDDYEHHCRGEAVVVDEAVSLLAAPPGPADGE